MDTPSPLSIAHMVLNAPGWARVGITAPNERLRQEAALELGNVIVDQIERPVAGLAGQARMNEALREAVGLGNPPARSLTRWQDGLLRKRTLNVSYFADKFRR